MADPAPALAPFVLDACALIAFFNDEQGADRVDQLITQAEAGEAQLYVASVNLYEVYYDALRRGAAEKAEELLNDLYALPITVIETIDKALMRRAGYFKTTYRVSVADSIALGLAQLLGAHLVSTDQHEFDTLEQAGAAQFFRLR
ncbi:MAG: PilT protein domain protein [Anaerolineales bacterium]|nr:PilT protein domain protein [Anaerolineales bacterium]